MNDPRLDQMIERMRKKADRMMAGGMRTRKIAFKILRWAEGCWRGLGKPDWLNPKSISDDAMLYVESSRRQSRQPQMILRKSGETAIRRQPDRPAPAPEVVRSGWVCGSCLREYKKSRDGRIERKRFLNGDLTAAWNHGRWPSWVYHHNGRGLCAKHRGQMMTRMIGRYRTRNDVVIALGFTGYRAYLDSDLWKSIRGRCFETFGSTCHFCGGDAEQVHHARYNEKVMSGSDLSALYPVCRSCHLAGEFAINGDKLPPETATARMRELGFAAGHRKHIYEMDRKRADSIMMLTSDNAKA